ncbi:HNH endonuclease [Oceanobacillus oncorhynchi]|uniref:HNH endonuclease n=1 Tax=Oceanobacillus oncorhynchi TaxID=545501 RepID=UPI0025A41745|nr:HNH endonuclease [Oceanobacillus oncorhynchi]MDM8098671.1 HNH endonuclease [Oceanobacillus oncorhynchi]
MPEYKTYEQKKRFYRSKPWQSLREQALERDHYECQHCKAEGKVTVDSIKTPGERKEIVLNVDHIYPIEDYPKLALVLDNLQTLCVFHHNVKEGRVFEKKKSKWDDEWW